jgi:hypothetical protein
MNTERGNQADIRAFGSFNRAESAIMRIVNITNLKTGTFSGQATGPRADIRRLCVSSASGLV